MIHTIYSLVIIIIIVLGLYKLKNIEKQYSEEISKARKDSVEKSKAVTRGKIAEEFIPLFPDFPYNLSDCKFSGQPIDFIVFKGMSDLRDGLNSEIEIILADVKVNKAQRTKIQNAIKKAVEEKRFKFETWKIDENKKIIIK